MKIGYVIYGVTAIWSGYFDPFFKISGSVIICNAPLRRRRNRRHLFLSRTCMSVTLFCRTYLPSVIRLTAIYILLRHGVMLLDPLWYIWYWRASEVHETLSGLFNRESLYIFLVCMSRLPFDLHRGHLNDSITRKEGFSVFFFWYFYYENRAMRNQNYDFFCHRIHCWRLIPLIPVRGLKPGRWPW